MTLGKTINKRILLGIGGGIAAYKSAELVRLLRKQGNEVRVVMTAAATQFIAPLTFQALSGNPVHTTLLDADAENAMSHIHLARWADMLLIAPTTADLLAKFSHGLADELLTTLYLAATCPVYLVPAMNQAMWHKPVVQENVKKLKDHGVKFIGPEAGDQACGEIGFGRMTEPEQICHHLFIPKTSRVFHGIKILISAGPTREPLDPVRYITNRSSGKMGYALAAMAISAGAEVTLVSGPVSLPKPEGATIIDVETSAQMYEAVINVATKHDIYIGAAAVADYSPLPVSKKIKKGNSQTQLLLYKTQDILASVAKLSPRPFTVGFAAETDNLEQYALSKLKEKNLDMIAANWVGKETGGFDSDQNALQVYWPSGQKNLPLTNKNQLAEQLIDIIAQRLQSASK